MAEVEVIALWEALYKQAQSIQELSAELEEERKAAASGADEALSMILRLQEEKALEKMEASQYKRMAEAKMDHAEESLTFLREAMFQKEIEIATLKIQIQTYRQKMVRVGITNPDAEEIKIFEESNLGRTCTFLGVTDSDGRPRKHISMPSSWFGNLSLEDTVYKNLPLIPTVLSIRNEAGECSKPLRECWMKCFSNESVIEEVASGSVESLENFGLSLTANTEDRFVSTSVAAENEFQQNITCDSIYWGEKEPGKCSGYSQKNLDYLSGSTIGSIQVTSKSESSPLQSYGKHQEYRPEHVLFSSSCMEKDSTGKTMHLMNIEDKYELPKCSYGTSSDEPCSSESMKTILQAKKMAEVPCSFVQPATGTLGDGLSNRPSIIKKGVSMNSLGTSGVNSFQSELKQLKEWLHQVENNQLIMQEEESKRNNEQLNLLRRITEKLNLIQSQTEVLKHKKLSRQNEILLVSITEAILSFSL